jgi:hypothetical protein
MSAAVSLPAFSAEWISAIFAILSGAAAAMSFFSSRAATRNAFRLEWTRDVIGWGTRAVNAISEAHSLCQAKTETEVAALQPRVRVLTDLSALIDQGRFFFENRRHPSYGADKPPAYRGHRPVMLDHLVYVHQCLRDAVIPNPGGDKDSAHRVWDQRRKFVSELQKIIEPRWLSRQANYRREANA